MSKIIASAAIRGAHKIVGRAEENLNKALTEYGEEKAVEFPNTGYFLPVIYGMTGLEVRTLKDLKPVLERTKSLLPPVPSEKVWLPYLGHTLDAGMATLFADEIIEVLKYVKNPIPYTMTTSPLDGNLWLGAADDVIMRERGIEFVDGTAPGFAAIVGAAPDSDTAVKIVRELQEKNLYVFISSETEGLSFAEQLKEKGVELGWETRLVPFGKDITATVFSLGFATRAAMSFGGVKAGDFQGNLLYNKNRIFAFVLALGYVDEEKYAQAAGAINYGFPTIADTPIPQILPTGITTYEHVVSNIPHEKIVSKAIEVRGLKVTITKIPIAVSYGPAFEGERIRKENMFIEMRREFTPVFELLTTKEPEEVEDGKITLVGPDITNLKEPARLPYGLLVEVAGRKMQKDFEPVLERQLHRFVNYAQGALHIGQRDGVWIRISKEAKEKGLKFTQLGEAVRAKLLEEYGALVDKVQVTIYTDEKKVKELLPMARAIYEERDERLAGLTDESVEDYYSCILCVPQGEEIVFPDGSFQPVEKVIEEAAENPEIKVLSLDKSELKTKPVGELFINPAPKSLLKITLSNGNSLTLTPNHKVLTDTDQGLSWVPAWRLKPRDYLLSPTITKNGEDKKKTFYLIDFLPDEIKVCDNQFLSTLKEAIFKRYKTLAEAARDFKLPYKKLYYAFYSKEGAPYRVGHYRFTLGEMRAIAYKLGLDWEKIKVQVQRFGTFKSRGYRLLKNTLDEEIMYAAGLVAADGSVIRRQKGTFVQFTNAENALVEKFNQIISSLFGITPKTYPQEPYFSVSDKLEVRAKRKTLVAKVNNPVIGLLMRGLGIGTDQNRERKWSGEVISTFSPSLVAVFLRGLFDGDGHITKDHIVISTRSYKEAQHILLLLKKLGISSYISQTTRGFQVGTRNNRDFRLFREIISSHHPKKKAKMERFQPPLNEDRVVFTDSLPKFSRKLLKELLVKESEKIEITKLRVDYKTIENWVKGKARISKEKLRVLLEELKTKINTNNLIYQELLKWCNSSMRFEKIRAIEKAKNGHREVYNFSVEDTHNYLVNGVVVKNCQSFSPNHVCIITPQKLGLCGAYNWLDAKASYEISPAGGNEKIPKGEVIDAEKGQWKGVNEYIYEKTNQTLEKFNAYSIILEPSTSCGCFQCILAVLPMCNGVMVVPREYPEMTPCGMKFSTLAGTVGGGIQTPGFMGVGKVYLTSLKFISADGGFKRLVWMPKMLKEELDEKLKKRSEEIGTPDFADKIATEEEATSEEEVLKFMEKVGHPALEMEQILK